MANFKDQSEYKKTTEYIYKTTAKRLKVRKLSLNLTDSQIAGDYDRKVISRIMNNTRTRNNVYLIPPAYVELLVRELGFDNDTELFWGNVEDETYVEEIFCNLLLDILGQGDENADLINDILIDDVSYAKIAATTKGIEYVSPEGEYLPLSPMAYVKNGKQYSRMERDKIRLDSILRLFKNTRPIEIFKEFFEEKNKLGENRGFSKLDKRLDEFVNRRIISYLKSNLPGLRSLGLRAYSISNTDISEYVELEFINDRIVDEEIEGITDPEINEIIKSLMLAGRDYIEKIEEVQYRLDKWQWKCKFGVTDV